MKLAGFFFSILICCNFLAQGQGNMITENTRTQHSYRERFSISKSILNCHAEPCLDGFKTKNSPIHLTLAMTETTDLMLICRRKKYELGIAFEDLFNMDWNNEQFSMLSRLKDEPTPVEEIDFNSGVSFLIRLKLSIPL